MTKRKSTKKDIKRRGCVITINNPEAHGITLNIVDKVVKALKPNYYCRCMEVGERGTKHIHIYFYRSSNIRFSTLKRRFPTAHIEEARGTASQNRDYIMKAGKWASTDKADTKVEGTFAEFGELPIEVRDRPKRLPMQVQVVAMIETGATDAEIIKAIPSAASQIKNLSAIRAAINKSKQPDFRKLEVVYLYGATGTGKTRSIFDNHDPADICRITHYPASGAVFDAYDAQDVLVLEEFASQIPLSSMLNYLDGYPLQLPARYLDRTALYTKVYITSNLPLEAQYMDETQARREALYRRINRIVEFKADSSTVVHKGGVPFPNESSETQERMVV